MQERILALAIGIVGASENEQQLLEALCIAAETAWVARLREGIAAEDCGEAFCCAVAFTAAADYIIGRSGNGVASFTAGEISIKGKDGSDGTIQAAALRQTAERLMTPYTEEKAFCFRGVRG